MDSENKNLILKLPPPTVIGADIFQDVISTESLTNPLLKDPQDSIFNKDEMEQAFLNNEATQDPSELEKINDDDYIASDYRMNLYKEVANKDKMFYDYVKGYYGSVENFFKFNTSLSEHKTYDPVNDYLAEVVIITKDKNYKAGFISQQEILMESLSGICTIEYFKINGLADVIVGTLSEEYIPTAEEEVRFHSFGGMGRGRVLIWNLLKGGWSSFYMQNLIRFVRDETTGLQ